MIVSIINGSPRSNGATATILKEIKNYLSEEYGVDVFYVDLAKSDMQFCKGCISCYRTGKCVITDDGIEEISAKVKESDGIVIGSPTYESNVSGHLKTFMDRGHFVLEQSLLSKYGFAVATEEIADGNQVIKIIKKFFLVSGASRRGQFLVKLDFNTDPFSNPRTRKRLHRKLDRFYQAMVQKRNKSLFERIFNDLIVVQVIWKPIFRRHPKKYAGILNMWKEKQII